MEDKKGTDPKTLSVLSSDLRFDEYKDLKNVQKHQLNEIQEFFHTYKRLEPCKWVKIKYWKNKKEAEQIITLAMKRYQKLTGNTYQTKATIEEKTEAIPPNRGQIMIKNS